MPWRCRLPAPIAPKDPWQNTKKWRAGAPGGARPATSGTKLRWLGDGDELHQVPDLGQALGDDVAVRDHALEPLVLAADRQRADLQLQHLLCRGLQRFVFTD